MDIGRGQFGNIEDDIDAEIAKSGDVYVFNTDALGLQVVYGAINGVGVGVRGVFRRGDVKPSGAVEDGMGASTDWRQNGVGLGLG